MHKNIRRFIVQQDTGLAFKCLFRPVYVGFNTRYVEARKVSSVYRTSCLNRVAVISAKNHKRQRRKRQSVIVLAIPCRNRQTRKVANAKGLNRNTNLT